MPAALAGGGIQKMIEPPVFLGSGAGEKAQSRDHAKARHIVADPAVLGGNAHRAQSETRGRDTGNTLVIGTVLESSSRQGAVKHQPGVKIRLFPEISEGASREIVYEIKIFSGKGWMCLEAVFGGAIRRSTGHQTNQNQEDTNPKTRTWHVL